MGARINKVRQCYRERQEEFANRLEIHRSQLSDIENDKKVPSKTLVKRKCEKR
jgi:transcriptional regulator with XRE-family HTH domain